MFTTEYADVRSVAIALATSLVDMITELTGCDEGRDLIRKSAGERSHFSTEKALTYLQKRLPKEAKFDDLRSFLIGIFDKGKSGIRVTAEETANHLRWLGEQFTTEYDPSSVTLPDMEPVIATHPPHRGGGATSGGGETDT